MPDDNLTYDDYLQLDTILNSQHLQSTQQGHTVPDEMFFIIVHQSYELWFKNLLFELERICTALKQNDLSLTGKVIWLLKRVTSIQQLLNQQLSVIDTLSPKDFLAFRDYLANASGFQSLQFRLLEARLGALNDTNGIPPKIQQALTPAGQKQFAILLQEPSLFQVVNTWLCHFAETQFDCDAFWQDYRICFHESFPDSTATDLFNPDSYLTCFDATQQSLSYAACQAALFIMQYSDNAATYSAHQLLRKVLKVDDLLAKWRFGHSLMVQRMIGSKKGTGGSSGYQYLKQTVDKQRIFLNLSHLATYLVPSDHLAPAELYLSK